MTTEQEVIDLFFPDDNTKNITDVITLLTDLQHQNGWVECTEDYSKNALKSGLPDITDWSF